MIQRGRQSRLTDERIQLLNKIEFIWEAQRGGPRRKRKATVAVPPKANPVDMAKLRAKTSTRGRGGSAAGGASTSSGEGENGNTADLAPALAALGGAANVLPASLLLPAQQWQLLASGAFQKNNSQGGANLNQAAALFPLASQIPLATAGFQFGINPLAAQLAALQQQQQAALLLNAGVVAASANLQQEGPKTKKQKSDGDADDEDGSEKPSASDKPKNTETAGDENGKELFYDADE